MNLESIQGIGPTLAQAIRQQFDGDDAFFAAARDGDLESLERVEGISPKRAVDLVRHVRGDQDADKLLATAGTRKVYQHIMDQIRRFAATEHGRNRLRLLGPVASRMEASKRMAHVMQQKARLANLDDAALRRLLRQVKPLQWPKPVCDMTCQVIVPDNDTLELLHDQGVGRWAMMVTARDADPDAELSIAVYGDGPGPDGDVDIAVERGLAGIAPHAWHAWANHNLATLRAVHELAHLLGQTSAATPLLALDTAAPTQVDERTLRAAISDVKQQLDAELEQTLTRLQLSGAEMMRAMRDNKLPDALQAAVDDARKQAKQLLAEKTGVTLQPFLATFPLDIDEDELERFLAAQQTEARVKRFEAMQKVAKQLADAEDALQAEVANWLEQDAEFALGAFAKHYDLRPAHFGDALQINRGIHLDLAANPSAQRIDYHMNGASRIVLTGANSGGKSTLLEQITQAVVMSHMGLPVVGDATIPWYDAMHLVTARRGLDAGAFETFLRHFVPIADAPGRCLVLADEVESVTELEAAGRILAFFLDRLATTDSHCILVSHMAKPILQHVQSEVRIDGIEATGLDENNQLIVDRQPKMGHFARSTPELIIQRLARDGGDLTPLFTDLLGCLQDPKTRK